MHIPCGTISLQPRLRAQKRRCIKILEAFARSWLSTAAPPLITYVVPCDECWQSDPADLSSNFKIAVARAKERDLPLANPQALRDLFQSLAPFQFTDALVDLVQNTFRNTEGALDFLVILGHFRVLTENLSNSCKPCVNIFREQPRYLANQKRIFCDSLHFRRG